MDGFLNFYPFTIVQREYLGTQMEEGQLTDRILGNFYRTMDQHKEITKLRRMPNAVVFQNQLFFNLTSRPIALFGTIDEGSVTLSQRKHSWQLEYKYSLRHSIFIALFSATFVALGLQSLFAFQVLSVALLALVLIPTVVRQRRWFQSTLKLAISKDSTAKKDQGDV